MNLKSIILILQAHGAWLVPLIVAIGGGFGFVYNEYTSEKPAVLKGHIKGTKKPVVMHLDGNIEKKFTSKKGFYRIENIMPGEHEIDFGPEGSEAQTHMITIESGAEQTLDLYWETEDDPPEHINDTSLQGLAILRGQVTGIPGPVIVSIDGNKETKSNFEGYYRIENIIPGVHEISFGPEKWEKQAIITKIESGTEQSLQLHWKISNDRPVYTYDTPLQKTHSNIHSWYAGTDFNGTIDMTDTFGFIWYCSGGTCKLTGPYGQGLNMDVCRELSGRVGHLDYYYNDVGMRWTKTENSTLLEQCNSQNNISENESMLQLEADWTVFLKKVPRTLNELIHPVGQCLRNRATDSPIFNGCIDWHSAVHGSWAALRYEYMTNNNQYFSYVDGLINAKSVEKEFEYLKNNPQFEMPYGRAWFLRFAIEYKNTKKNPIFDQMADYVAKSMIIYFNSTEIDPLAPAYENPSWALINLFEYGKYKNDAEISKFVLNYTSKHFLQALDTCNLKNEIDQNSDFMAECSNMAYLLAKTGHKEYVKRWVQTISPGDGDPLKNPKGIHQKGLNFSRAWAFYGLYSELRNPLFLNFYLKSFNYEFSHAEWWEGDYSVGHWVPQFGIYALTIGL